MRCYLALGGNLGPVEKTFDAACAMLESNDMSVTARSRTFVTVAVGNNAGDDFRNAAVEIETTLSPLNLLERMNVIENELGRERIVHWGPRTLDLDLLLYGDNVIANQRLDVPHPGCWYRRFVLDPLVEIGGNAFHPVKQVTIRELHNRLLTRPLSVHVCGGTTAQRKDLQEQIRQMEEVELTADISVPATMHLWLGESKEPSDHGSESLKALPLISRCDISTAKNVVDYGTWVVESMLG